MDWNVSPTIRALIYTCVACYLAEFAIGTQVFDLFGLVPARVLGDRWVWQTVTYMFLHGNIWHLLLNLFALWMFGRMVENAWGPAEFLKFCLICGLGGAAFHLAFTPSSPVPVIGASAVVYGLLVAFAMLYPDAIIYLYLFIPMKAKYVALLFGMIEFLSSPTSSHVANLAHLGGMVTGYLYIRWWWEVQSRAAAFGREIWSRVSGSEAGEDRPRRRRSHPPAPPPSDDLSTEVDRILDKILVQGVDSLTPEEKETMKQFSRKQKHDA